MKHCPTLLASLALALPAIAIDTPADTAPPPPNAAAPEADTQVPEAQAPSNAAANVEATPYLGLGTSTLPRFLGKHLNLPADSGVLVRSLDPAGPAAKAGFTEDDVITKVEGQAVTSHREMVDLIRDKKPGDEVNLDFIHEGKPGQRSVVLGKRPAPMPEGRLEGEGAGLIPGMDNLGAGMREALEKALKDGANGMGIQIIPGGAGGVQIIPRGEAGGDGRRPGIHFSTASSIHMMDQDGSIELKKVDGGSEVRVLDKGGKEVWSGPWDTAQDKAAAPQKVRQRLENLHLDMDLRKGIQRDMNPGDNPPEAPAKPEKPARPAQP
ncbi:MAG: PDZ domain-containing protein [Verrucomicrobia bacterium]|nr:PDZ domain-containing protein [Verrucomicrobiota bacterium]